MKFLGATLLLAFTLWNGVLSQNIGDMEILAEWVLVEFDWDSEEQRNASIANGTYIPENNVITGIKVHDDVTYVCVSRWLPGVPSTMNTLVYKDGAPLLKPFPNWEMQEMDNCDAFQFTQSMEIVPQTNEMWIIDVGRRNIWLDESINNCPPKLRIMNLATNEIIYTHTFPDAVYSYTQNFLNDIAVDPEGGFAYMSDTGASSTGHDGGIVFFDRANNVSRRLEHPSMKWEVNREDGGYDMVVNGTAYDMTVPSDGVAVSTDKDTIFYCSLGGVHLYQVAAQRFKDCNQDVCTLTDAQVRDMGPKVSESDGIVWGHRSLYFAAMGQNAVYMWDHQADMEEQGVNDLWNVNMTKQVLLKRDDDSLIWADTFAFDDEGWLYTTANRLPLFSNNELDYNGESGANFKIVRIYVDDKSYLEPEDNSSQTITSSSFTIFLSALFALFLWSRY